MVNVRMRMMSTKERYSTYIVLDKCVVVGRSMTLLDGHAPARIDVAYVTATLYGWSQGAIQ